MPARPSRRVIALALLALVALAAALFLPVQAWAGALAVRVRGLGLLGPLAFLAAYLTATLLAVPISPISAAAGLAFGPFLGAALAAPCIAASASVAFLVGRRVAGGAPYRPASGLLATALQLADHRGFRLILLLRLSPLTPFAPLNFAFGATRMRLRDFALASLLGSLLPATCYAAIGASVGAPGGVGTRALAAAGALLTAVAGAGCARLVYRGVARPAPRGGGAPGADPG